jgi:N-methylhydantoinase B
MEFEEWMLWPDSGGPGKFRGGVGSRKTFRITEGNARLSCLGDRELYPPFGILGGLAGGNHGLIKNEGSADETNLTLKASGVPLKVGDRVTIKAGGGGGYGNPLERDPELVVNDVFMGFVSCDKAKTDYGVVISDDGKLDDAATRQLRKSMQGNSRH